MQILFNYRLMKILKLSVNSQGRFIKFPSYPGDDCFVSINSDYLNKIPLLSLEGFYKKVFGNVDLATCRELTSLEGIGKDFLLEIHGTLLLPSSLKRNVLGILKIKNLIEVLVVNERNIILPNEDFHRVAEMLNHHLHSGKNINKCKSELIEAGLEEFAQL